MSTAIPIPPLPSRSPKDGEQLFDRPAAETGTTIKILKVAEQASRDEQVYARVLRSVQFRAVSGYRAAELLHTQKLVARVRRRQGQVSWPETSHELPITKLDRTTDELRHQLESWRIKYFQLKRKSTEQTIEHEVDGANHRTVGDLLVVVDSAEFTWLFRILDEGEASVDEVVADLGNERALRLSNMLGRAEAATVYAGRILATSFGRALGKSLTTILEEEEAADEGTGSN